MNDVKAEDYYESLVYDVDPEGEVYEYDEDSDEGCRIMERNSARKSVLDMINVHHNLQLEGLRKYKRNIDGPIKTLCHACVCYEMPGIVSTICYGAVTLAGEYVYYWG